MKPVAGALGMALGIARLALNIFYRRRLAVLSGG